VLGRSEFLGSAAAIDRCGFAHYGKP